MRRPLLLAAWLLSDVLLFVAAYAFAYFARVGWIFSTDLPAARFLGAVAIAAIPWLLALVTTRTFGLTRSQATLRNAAYMAYASAIGGAAVALMYYFVYAMVFSRLILVLGMLTSWAALWLWHLAFEKILRHALTTDTPAYPTLVIGVTRESRQLIELLKARHNPLAPVAILDGAGAQDKDVAGVPVLGKLNKLDQVLTDKRITHMIQCSDLEQSINLLGACRARGITYLLLPSILGIVERDERMEALEGRSVTVIAPKSGLFDWFFR
jgi:FlaA1/EpsC-like NDP-sugar epimerase